MDPMRIRRLLVDSPTSVGGRARARRWETFHQVFPEIEKMKVLDLGGTAAFWQTVPTRPAHVTLVNLQVDGRTAGEGFTSLSGDACRASEVLAENGVDPDFDVVFSNSLIEHVGGHSKRSDLAHQVRSLAPRHWVQTPYRYFPVEPHWVFPGMQFMPAAARVQIDLRWPLGGKAPNEAAARRRVLWTELLSVTEMRDYFPESTIVRERMAGLTKSLIAVK